jgi:hypothetical protein
MALFGSRKEEEKKPEPSKHNSQVENELVTAIDFAQTYAEGGKRPSIERDWKDEYYIYIGKQWDTSKGPRSEKGKKRNFNSQDNFILPTIQNMLSSFSEMPIPDISGKEVGDDPAAKILTDLTINIFERNHFDEQYSKIVLQMLQYGPVIGYVSWDQHWMGGTGPNRWVGEVRTLFVKKGEFYPDPAILDLEERLQECSFINLKQRKKIEWFKEIWPKKGQYVVEDNQDIPKGQENEGPDPKQATLITHFHKGVPKFVPEEWKEIFLRKAEETEPTDPYRAQDYRDMAAGTLKGVHCAYKVGAILLDYVPYIYDDGLYPFVYKVLYADEEQPWGMGEERNILIPQLLHNKADEIELGAMLGQGLGGGFYNKGTVSQSQKEELLDNIAKPNVWIEVNDWHGIKEKQAVQVPANITNYKNSKKDVIDTVSRNTAILQGVAPGANTPLGVVRELGARADAGTYYKAQVLERFMVPFVELVVNRIIQFYTEDRKYRILGNSKADIEKQIVEGVMQIANMPQGTPPEQQLQAMVQLLMFAKTQGQPQRRMGKFNRKMLVRTWDREIVTDAVTGEKTVKREEFIPEFDIKVKIIKEKPTDRNYFTNMALQLLGRAMGPKAFWSTMDNGKFPPVDDILAELQEIQQAQAQAIMAAQTAQTQAEQQENDKDRQASIAKQVLTTQSQERMTAIKAAAKGGAR